MTEMMTEEETVQIKITDQGDPDSVIKMQMVNHIHLESKMMIEDVKEANGAMLQTQIQKMKREISTKIL